MPFSFNNDVDPAVHISPLDHQTRMAQVQNQHASLLSSRWIKRLMPDPLAEMAKSPVLNYGNSREAMKQLSVPEERLPNLFSSAASQNLAAAPSFRGSSHLEVFDCFELLRRDSFKGNQGGVEEKEENFREGQTYSSRELQRVKSGLKPCGSDNLKEQLMRNLAVGPKQELPPSITFKPSFEKFGGRQDVRSKIEGIETSISLWASRWTSPKSLAKGSNKGLFASKRQKPQMPWNGNIDAARVDSTSGHQVSPLLTQGFDARNPETQPQSPSALELKESDRVVLAEGIGKRERVDGLNSAGFVFHDYSRFSSPAPQSPANASEVKSSARSGSCNSLLPEQLARMRVLMGWDKDEALVETGSESSNKRLRRNEFSSSRPEGGEQHVQSSETALHVKPGNDGWESRTERLYGPLMDGYEAVNEQFEGTFSSRHHGSGLRVEIPVCVEADNFPPCPLNIRRVEPTVQPPITAMARGNPGKDNDEPARDPHQAWLQRWMSPGPAGKRAEGCEPKDQGQSPKLIRFGSFSVVGSRKRGFENESGQRGDGLGMNAETEAESQRKKWVKVSMRPKLKAVGRFALKKKDSVSPDRS